MLGIVDDELPTWLRIPKKELEDAWHRVESVVEDEVRGSLALEVSLF